MILKKKILSIVFITLAVFLMLVIIMNSIYLWRLFGYFFCENPKDIQVFYIENNIATNNVIIKGKTNDISKKYAGFAHRIENNTMYIGFKYNVLWGYEENKLDFSLTIPYGQQKVTKVVIVNSSEEKQVWPNS